MEYRFLWFVSTCNNDFEASSTSLMSLWANIKFVPEPTGELYGWLLATLVYKHIDKSTQQMNLKVHSYIFFTMRLAVKHSISSSWSSSRSSAVVTHSMSSSRLAFSRMLLLAITHSIYSSQWIPLHFFCSRWILAWVFFSLFCFVRCF